MPGRCRSGNNFEQRVTCVVGHFPSLANYCSIVRSFQLFRFILTPVLVRPFFPFSYPRSLLDMGCVQSTGIDSEAKARAYPLLPTPAFTRDASSFPPALQATMRSKTSSKRTKCWPRTRLRCCCLERESLERSVLVHSRHWLGSPNPALQLQSTVLKQMKLIHHGGYNDQERDSYKEIIFSNTIQSMRYARLFLPLLFSVTRSSAILEAMPQLDITLSPQNDARRAVILALPMQIEGEVLPRDVADSIRGLWRDPGVKEAVRRSREFQLNDSAVYYFNAIDRMSGPGYLPTDQDILRSRVKTTGITETNFKVGELTYKLFDVGGQRSERKKWIHCFENVTALVFLVSLSEYDQMLYEDESVVRTFFFCLFSTLGH